MIGGHSLSLSLRLSNSEVGEGRPGGQMGLADSAMPGLWMVLALVCQRP